MGRSTSNDIKEIENVSGERITGDENIAEIFKNYFVSCSSKISTTPVKDVKLSNQEVEKYVKNSIVHLPPENKEIETTYN